jgi:flagella basal body P-ring formation protein FlgA
MMMLPFLLAVVSLPPGCRSIETEMVVARDVAAVIPAFGQLPDDFLLGYVNASGTPHIFKGADLERIAKNHDLELHDLPDVCLARKTFLPQPEQIREAMMTELGIPGAKIEIVTSSQNPAPSGDLVFPRAGLQLPVAPSTDIVWHGYVLYGDNLKFPVWARARVTASVTRVIAVTDLPAGQPIQANQVRLETGEDSPLDPAIARNLEEVTGFQPKSAVKAQAPIRKSQLERVADIKPGDVIRVDVFEGGAHLTLEARAETAGFKGSTISVKNVSSGKSFQARVTGKDQAVVGGQIQ